MSNGIACAMGCNTSPPAFRVASFASLGKSGIFEKRSEGTFRSSPSSRIFALSGFFLPHARWFFSHFCKPATIPFLCWENVLSPPLIRNNFCRVIRAPCALHPHISRPLPHALCTFLLLQECL